MSNTTLSKTEKADLRARAEAIAADCAAPLPEGDAGLIEAERRLRDYLPRDEALYRDFDITGAIEEELIEPTIIAAVNALTDFIENTAPSTLKGALVKLRLVIDPSQGPLDENRRSVAQVVALLEREAAGLPMA